jgi:hypothetical protein
LFPRKRRSRRVGGTKLVLSDPPTNSAARRFQIQSHDATELILGDGSDPTPLLTAGGTLRVVAVGGDGFDETYLLDPEGWEPIDPRNPRAGIRYRDADGPITNVVFRANTTLRIAGKGLQLGQTLRSEPEAIQVVLQLDDYEYCFEFGGSVQRFTAGRRKLLRKSALRPLACPDDYASLGALPVR